MKSSDTSKAGFNSTTIPWTTPDLSGFDSRNVPEHSTDQKDIETYQRDGVVILRGAFTEWVEPLRAGLERNLAEPEAYRYPCESLPPGTPGRFFDSYCNWDLIPEYRDFALNSSAASLAGQLMQSNTSRLFHEHAFLKESGTQRATPWHQDMPYYCVDGNQTASVYVALDSADKDVAVRFIRGSHATGKLYYPRVFMDGASFNTDDPSMSPAPDITDNPDDKDLVAEALEPGDAIVFSFLTLHGTTDAPLKSRRRAFSTRWFGDDVTYCERIGETSPSYPDINLSPGDRMREDWFPAIWRKQG